MEIELERTFLLKYKPENLEQSPSCEILDIYFPETSEHPVLRLRSRDNKKFEMTKKFSCGSHDGSEHEEHTIKLSKEEFDSLVKQDGKRIFKKRYYYETPNGIKAEVDIFLEKLKGLCVVDFEFNTNEEKEKFIPPDFCSSEITPDIQLAGGILAGGEYEKIEKHLEQYNYKKL
jgi:CYTH domain-containing protein